MLKIQPQSKTASELLLILLHLQEKLLQSTSDRKSLETDAFSTDTLFKIIFCEFKNLIQLSKK